MPTFYFNMRERGRFANDEVGLELANIDTLRTQILSAVRSIVANEQVLRIGDDRVCEVTNEAGDLVLSFRFSDAYKFD